MVKTKHQMRLSTFLTACRARWMTVGLPFLFHPAASKTIFYWRLRVTRKKAPLVRKFQSKQKGAVYLHHETTKHSTVRSMVIWCHNGMQFVLISFLFDSNTKTNTKERRKTISASESFKVCSFTFTNYSNHRTTVIISTHQ